MISVQTASQIVKENLTFNPQVTAQSVRADRDYPPFNRVMMDGIGVMFASFEKGLREFFVEGVQAAGEPAKKLTDQKNCLEVMTGAPLPMGADLVIPYEHVIITDGVARITQDHARAVFENVHLKGSDCREGDEVLSAHQVLNGPHQGIAASMGVVLSLTESPRILIISTGDELVEVDELPLVHQIRRSNAHALKMSLEQNGFSDVELAHLKDEASSIAAHYKAATQKYDVMIYSGGVSMGKFDYLPHVWTESGVKKLFHGVAQRPGKPLWFGVDEKNKTHVIGLPGNPVSSLVCLHRYFLPSRPLYARLSEEVTFHKALTFFVPVKIESRMDGCLWALPLKIKNSGEFTALAGSDGFIELPAQKNVFAPGEVFSFYSWRGL